jgi:hypothetical protein
MLSTDRKHVKTAHTTRSTHTCDATTPETNYTLAMRTTAAVLPYRDYCSCTTVANSSMRPQQMIAVLLVVAIVVQSVEV